MRLTAQDEQRIARIESMIVSIARGTVKRRGGVLQLGHRQGIGRSRAGMVTGVAALVGGAVGGAVLVLHAGGVGDRLRASARDASSSIQTVPDFVLPAPTPTVAATPAAAVTIAHRGHARRPGEARRGTGASSASVAFARQNDAHRPSRHSINTIDEPFAAQAVRDDYAEDARRTREMNEAVLDRIDRR